MTNAYQFTDEMPMEGVNYYRLKQVDNDGRFIYTVARLLKFSGGDRQSIKVYPNPTKGLVYLELSAAMAGESKLINISTVTGVVVDQLRLGASPNKVIPLNMGGYRAGAYFIHVKTASGNRTQRVVVL